MSKISALFIPCYYDGLPRDSGSARIRAEWVCRYWDGAEVYDGSQRFAGYNLYIFQKAYLTHHPQRWIRTVARWRDEEGLPVRLAFDLCDPDFLDDEHRRRMLAVLPLFDFAVATTDPIADWLCQWLPVQVIPDRVDLVEVGRIGVKTDARSEPPRLVWAGYERNVGALNDLRRAAKDMGLPVDVLAVDRPLPFDEFWRRVTEYDILLNPRPNKPPFTYKSDNKTLIARALGVPVARTVGELEALCDSATWRNKAVCGMDDVKTRWDVRLSAHEWISIASDYYE